MPDFILFPTILPQICPAIPFFAQISCTKHHTGKPHQQRKVIFYKASNALQKSRKSLSPAIHADSLNSQRFSQEKTEEKQEITASSKESKACHQKQKAFNQGKKTLQYKEKVFYQKKREGYSKTERANARQDLSSACFTGTFVRSNGRQALVSYRVAVPPLHPKSHHNS